MRDTELGIPSKEDLHRHREQYRAERGQYWYGRQFEPIEGPPFLPPLHQSRRQWPWLALQLTIFVSILIACMYWEQQSGQHFGHAPTLYAFGFAFIATWIVAKIIELAFFIRCRLEGLSSNHGQSPYRPHELTRSDRRRSKLAKPLPRFGIGEQVRKLIDPPA